ncbi:outer membrane lipoprotein chaperone LolA [Biformimicrobium ophioploci]|uniref:Outer-membrane lipoprotein carrier protein n=1 Tax=Biformimicrobium ophioploci TaxID=3036711 RepID=A0ABQ6M1Q9_9GAMM|nr:outer membrane lipoprotein chaperone LolA [Microbulbifer sp. NKW57]GMG88219.1 outer membrane lipoprotein chaperone LolA [Microbulbifer sp. NKW57]
MSYSSRVIAILALLLPFSLPVVAKDAVSELSALLGPLASLEGSFRQQIFDESGEELQSSNGKFHVQRPGRIRWESNEPFPQLLVTNNSTIWLYDPDLEQVTVRKTDRGLHETPALLLGGNPAEIASAFHVGKAGKRFQLSPKKSGSPFRFLEIEFDKKGLPKNMSVRDSMGQTTKIRFSRVKANPSLNAGLFQFTPPPGTDIIKE